MKNEIRIYKVKASKFSGSSFKEVNKKALDVYKQIKNKTKRRPYIRSAYFEGQKIFLELFWNHLREKKNFRDKVRRLKYFLCAIELIKKSNFSPRTIESPSRSSELFHRFAGATKENDLFFAQIKENKKNGEKWLMSVFPENK